MASHHVRNKSTSIQMHPSDATIPLTCDLNVRRLGLQVECLWETTISSKALSYITVHRVPCFDSSMAGPRARQALQTAIHSPEFPLWVVAPKQNTLKQARVERP